MDIKMKFFTKTTAALVGSAVMLSAVPASAQISSVGQLLDKVRQDAAKTAQENREREAKFAARQPLKVILAKCLVLLARKLVSLKLSWITHLLHRSTQRVPLFWARFPNLKRFRIRTS